VEILGVRPQPNGLRTEQIVPNLACDDGFLTGRKYLMRDRDPLYTEKFDSLLTAIVMGCLAG